MLPDLMEVVTQCIIDPTNEEMYVENKPSLISSTAAITTNQERECLARIHENTQAEPRFSYELGEQVVLPDLMEVVTQCIIDPAHEEMYVENKPALHSSNWQMKITEDELCLESTDKKFKIDTPPHHEDGEVCLLPNLSLMQEVKDLSMLSLTERIENKVS